MESNQEREAKYNKIFSDSLIQLIPDIAWIVDERGNIILVNNAFENSTGFSKAEVIGKSSFEFFSKDELPNHLQQMLLYLSGNKKGQQDYFVFKIYGKSGKALNVETTAINLLDNENVKGIVVTARNISDRRVAISEKNKSEEEVKWLSKFLEENPSPILRVEKEGKILYSNSASKIIIRQIGSDDSLSLNPEWKNIISKHIQSGNEGKIDLEIEDKYFSLTITSLINNSYINIYATDITDRIVFQKQLLESEQRLQFLMNSTTEGILVHENGIILDLNQAVTRLFGYTAEEMLGKSVLFFANENNRELMKDNLRQDITPPYETILNRKEGTPVYVEITGRAHFYKGKKVKVVAIRDISERKKAELLSKENEERLRYFLSITSEGILLLEGRKIIDANSAFMRMTGLKAPEVIGQPIESLYDEKLREKLLSTSSQSNPVTTKFKFNRKDNSVIHVEILSQLQEYRGRTIRVALLRDITQLTKDEEDLLQAKKIAEEAQRAEEQFLAKMSHEIRTPMNGIIGLTDILLKEGGTKEQGEYLSLIKQSADNLLVIINDILDFSKIRSGKIQFENIDINLRELLKVIYSGTQPKAAEKKIAYTYSVDSSIPEFIKGDTVRLNQIILNLLSNALKFTEKGKIHLSGELVTKDENKILIQFKVEDTGIGIHEKDQTRIFETYSQAGTDTTRKFGGTGLGLPIVKQLVELQGGNIWLQSQPGVGSVFFFNLPFGVSEKTAKTSSEKGKTVTEKESVAKNGLTILLVDDNFINRLLVNHLLEQKGFEILEAENGYEAIEKLKEEDIDLVLMDISMPELDGLEATKIIRKMEPAYIRQIPIIAMTAHAFQEQIQGALDAGMNDYISKPFKPEELYTKIENQLNPPVVTPSSLKKEINMEDKFYDLTFLNQYYDNEEEFITSILSLYVKETPGSVTKIEECINRKDWAMLKSLVHKIKTNILMMGIKRAEPFVHEVAAINIQQVNEKSVLKSFDDFKQSVLTAIKQLAKDKL